MIRSLEAISKDLRAQATGQTPGDGALRKLAEAMRGGSAALSGIDLAAAYNPAVLLPEDTGRLRRAVDVLELLRDILIFVPVLYTWWKIGEALRAYDSYRGDEPFLLAWQQGFGGRTDPLSRSAVVVAAVVLAVILLTLAAYVVRARSERQARERQLRVSALLAEAGLAVNQAVIGQAPEVTRVELGAIGSQIASSTRSLQEALAKAGADITTAVDANPGSKLHDMFEKWTAAAAELTELGTRLQGTQEVVTELRATQAALTGMARDIGTETKRLLTALQSERDVSGQEAHAHRALAAEVSQSTQRLGEALHGLNERAEQFNELILRLAFVVDRIDAESGSYS